MEDQAVWHSKAPNDAEHEQAMQELLAACKGDLSMTEMIAPRDAFGKALAELGRENPNIVVLDADLAPVDQGRAISRPACPDRFFQVGIAEQNMVGMAAGLSTLGFIPFTSTFALLRHRPRARSDSNRRGPAAAQRQDGRRVRRV